MKWRAVFELIISFFGVMAFILVCGVLESVPTLATILLGGAISIILWVVYSILVVRDERKKVVPMKLFMMKDGQWVEIERKEKE